MNNRDLLGQYQAWCNWHYFNPDFESFLSFYEAMRDDFDAVRAAFLDSWESRNA